jgi:DNA-binding response OmpR family regulator
MKASLLNQPLRGRRILIVEDDYLLAEEARTTLMACGADIIGPAPDLPRGLSLAQTQDLHCAVLDINLRGEQVFPIAGKLIERGVPFIYATGYEPFIVPAGLESAGYIQKPYDNQKLQDLVVLLCGETGQSADGVLHSSAN